MKHVIPMGSKVEDIVTGYKGYVIGITYYITGCNQALVVAKIKGNEKRDGEWFDDCRLKIIDKNILELINHNPEIITTNTTVYKGGPSVEKEAPKI